MVHHNTGVCRARGGTRMPRSLLPLPLVFTHTSTRRGARPLSRPQVLVGMRQATTEAAAVASSPAGGEAGAWAQPQPQPTALAAAAVDGSDLSMALWALALLRRQQQQQQQQPAADVLQLMPEWLAAWWAAAAEPAVAATFDATCVSQSLWALAELRETPGLPHSGAAAAAAAAASGGAASSTYADAARDAGQQAAAQAAAGAVAALLAALVPQLGQAATADLSTTIAALADLQYR